MLDGAKGCIKQPSYSPYDPINRPRYSPYAVDTIDERKQRAARRQQIEVDAAATRRAIANAMQRSDPAESEKAELRLERAVGSRRGRLAAAMKAVTSASAHMAAVAADPHTFSGPRVPPRPSAIPSASFFAFLTFVTMEPPMR